MATLSPPPNPHSIARVYHHHRPFNFSLLLLILSLLTTIFFTPTSSRQIFPSSSSSYDTPRVSYSQHCSQLVPESTHISSSRPINPNKVPTFFASYVVNGDQILSPNSQITASLFPRSAFKTSQKHIFKIDASLAFRVVRFKRRNLLNVYGGLPRFPVGQRGLRFQLSGFWDSSSGHLCMVGFGTKRVSTGKPPLLFDVVFKSNYPNNTVITSSLVTGTLINLNAENSESYFKPISIMGFARSNYNYTLIDNKEEEIESGSTSLSNLNCHQFISLADKFELGYSSSCDGGSRNCSRLDGVLGFLPRYMSVNEIDCSGAMMVRVAFGFSDFNDIRNGYRQPLVDPNRTLVAEGSWNVEKTRLSFVACRILNFTENPLNASVGDCSTRVNFTFPASLTIRAPSVVTGEIWSNKSVGEPGYFGVSEIRASRSNRAALPGMKYEYTEIERAKKYCAEKKYFKSKGKSYPEPYSQDMIFDMGVRNSKGQGAWGRAHPVFVGNHLLPDVYPFFRSSVVPVPNSAVQVNNNLHGLLNLTYQISLSPRDEFKVGGRSFMSNSTILISAEGLYNTETGRLCMVGCWNRETGNTSKLDCDIFINLQFPPRNPNKGEVLKGTIESKREKSHPLYFEHLDFFATSLTKSQSDSAFWRMDFEITMVLISNTLTCIFVGLQLFHVKRNPEVLPSISIIMLVVITLGHMIPLLLNMEALFISSPSNKTTVLFGSGGWLEVNEVLVRVITMVAFLLEFRLLQLTWSSRASGEENETHKTLWASEKKVLTYSLPLYVVGALIAWLVQRLRGPSKTQFRRIIPRSSSPLPFWRDIKSYAGFILDAFLLPQIMFNIFSDSKDFSLSVPYYVGTTIVRLLPHGYDLFRAHSSAWKFDPWYIYANPGMNYYSTTWDILISCLGLLFVFLIYLQQRFGGRSVIPKRFRETVVYEKVPVGL